MAFTDLFYKHIMFRHSCGNCHYCNTQRPSDITIADFWGWDKTNPDANKDDKGISLVLVNTDKGRKLWNLIQEDLNTFPADLNDCLQPNLRNASEIHPKRGLFENLYKKFGFGVPYLLWGGLSKKNKLRFMWNYFIKR